MLRKQGKTWDGVPVPYLKAEDLDNATFDLFRKYAKRSGRMDDADLMDDNHGLLLSSHRSMPYNPDIANTFFRAGEIEAWGRGIERIIMACKNDGFSTPEFRYDASGIWTTFKFEYPERATTQSDHKTTHKTTQKTTHKTTQKTTQKAIQNLTEQQQAILSFLRGHPEATRKEISESLSNITEDGVKYNLSRLQELGLLKRIGGRKQGYWQIIE